MSEPAHSVRNSLIDKERSFALGADALNWRDAAGEGRMAYADVRDMRLIGYTSLIGEARQCTLRDRRGARVKIRSAHYRGLGNFEDRTETYAPFVAALAKRVAAQSPQAKFIAGSTGLGIVWLVLGVLSAIVVGSRCSPCSKACRRRRRRSWPWPSASPPWRSPSAASVRTARAASTRKRPRRTCWGQAEPA